MEFSEKVLFARKQLKLTQQAFAKELNISFNSLNRWENGRTVPQPAVMNLFFEYCKKHGITIGE